MSIFSNPQAFASPLIAEVTDRFGTAAYDWDPKSLRLSIEDTTGISLSADNMDKIQAGLLVLTTNQFLVSLESFIQVCNAMGGEGTDFESFDPAEVDEMAWTITEALLLVPAEQGLPQVFSQEIRHYILKASEYEGFVELPKPLSGVAGDLVKKVAAPVETDRLLYAASFSASRDAVAAVEAGVQAKFAAMMAQMNGLALTTGDHESWSEFSKQAPGWKQMSTRQGSVNL